MNETKTWCELCGRKMPSNGGRPSGVAEVIRMDLKPFFEMSGDGGSLRMVAEALRLWLISEGKRHSKATCLRVVRSLIDRGDLEGAVRARTGLGFVLKPRV